jgi:hypothetical protein
MLQYDKLKLICPFDVVENVNERVFQTIVRDGQLTSYKYQQDRPFHLLIRKDFIHSECVIEFTGKILSDRYPELINLNNIRYCIEQINVLGICEIDTERLLQTAKVAKCDVTKDVNSTEIKEIISQTKQNLTNYDKWEVEKYPNGICLRNKVTTERYKKRVCIYDKGKELKQQTNSSFLQSLHKSQRLLDYFQDKVRFELNIGTMVQVKRLLKIDDNSLIEVLNSTANPILSVIDEAIRHDSNSRQATSFKDYVYGLILADNHNDLAELEAKVRALVPKGTIIKRKMKPYRNYVTQHSDTPTLNIRDLLA